MKGRGYFVKETQIIEISGSTHVRYVLDHPGVFGLERDYLIALYRQHHEPIGYEGQARRAILTQLLREGWIRVRESTGRMQRWTIELDDYEVHKDHIHAFLERLQNEGAIGADDRIVIRQLAELHGGAAGSVVFTMGPK